METQNLSIFERLNTWIRESITIKLASIGFLVLILLIPQAWIESLIRERQYRAESVVKEISTKWSGEQTIAGPVLVIPYTKREKIDRGKDGIEIREVLDNAYFLPDQLDIDGKVNSQMLYRGIFEAVVYESALGMSANFLPPDFAKLKIAESDVQWNNAFMVVGISDLRGISENPKVKVGDHYYTGEPSNAIGLSSQTLQASSGEDRELVIPTPAKTSENGIIIRLPWKDATDFRGATSIQLNLKGSSQLNFSPVGETTTLNLSGPWTNPSFDGEFLPAARSVTEKGFTASWKVLHYNRPFAQEWAGSTQKISGSEFGVRLLIPVDQYQKSTRTAKYGVLVILLTFVSLFMVEIMKKIRIHPFQYILIGAALIIFYSLLLSFSEHVGYNLAYSISTAATVTLITVYAISFLRERKTIILFSSLLAVFYGFIFVIIQEQDYSLLLGSLGLFMIIAAIMYFFQEM